MKKTFYFSDVPWSWIKKLPYFLDERHAINYNLDYYVGKNVEIKCSVN